MIVDKKDLLCPISLQPFLIPVSLSCCGNLFEEESLEKHFESSTSCPLCRAKAPVMQAVPRLFAEMIKERIENDVQLKKEQYKSKSVSKLFKRFNFLAIKQFFIEYPEKINDFFNEKENPLFALVGLNKKNKISELLKLGADINSVSPETNMSAVQYAVTQNTLVTLQELVNAGADLNRQCNSHEFSYYRYCEEGDDDDDENEAGEYELTTSAPLYTALHMAAEFNRPEACRILITAGAALFVKNKHGQTAYDIANEEDNDCSAVFEERETLYQALKQDPQDDALFSKNLINRIGCYAMEEDDGKSFIDSCFTYLKENEPSAARLTALINFQKQTILDELQCLNQCENACELILKTHFIDESLDSEGSALHHFALFGSLDGVKLMLSRGAQINQTNDDGMTALMFAIKQGYGEIVQHLIEQNAHICIESQSQLSVMLSPSISPLFMTTKVLFKIAQELTLNDNRVKETMLALYPLAPDGINFLRRFKAICQKLQIEQLDPIIEALIKTEKMHINLITIVDFLEVEKTPCSSLGKRHSFFAGDDETWPAQVKQLLTRVSNLKSNWQETGLDMLYEEYQALLTSMPSDVREWVSVITDDLPEISQKRLKI